MFDKNTISTNSTHPFAPFRACAYTSSNYKPKYQNQNQSPNPIRTFCKPFTLPTILSLKSSHSKPSRFVPLCAPRAAKPSNAKLENSWLDEEVLSEETIVEDENSQSQWNVEVGNPIVPANVVKLSLSDQAFLLLAFIACTVTTPHPAIPLPSTLPPPLPSPLPSPCDASSLNLSGYYIFPVLNTVLQTNIVQRESILSLMKQVTGGGTTANRAVNREGMPAQIAAMEKSLLEASHDREKELLHEITELQWRNNSSPSSLTSHTVMGRRHKHWLQFMLCVLPLSWVLKVLFFAGSNRV